MNHGKRIWSEDECTRGLPGHERVTDAWLRLFGREMADDPVVEVEDCGDHSWHRTAGGVIYAHSYDGYEIYAPAEADTERTTPA